jgi:ubiquinone/menaquinone biosynthesis C-methylase UbiE
MDPKSHWESIYQTRDAQSLSWYQEHPTRSLAFIKMAAVGRADNIIDVGGGASTLVDRLLDARFQNVWVLDISSAALEAAKLRLGKRASSVHWIEADILQASLPSHQFRVWHDRAVFHFLVSEGDRRAYVRKMSDALGPGGHAVIATFGLEGPPKCSGLDVVRYSPENLARQLRPEFVLKSSEQEAHTTPFNTTQQFNYCLFQRA